MHICALLIVFLDQLAQTPCRFYFSRNFSGSTGRRCEGYPQQLIDGKLYFFPFAGLWYSYFQNPIFKGGFGFIRYEIIRQSKTAAKRSIGALKPMVIFLVDFLFLLFL